MQGAMTPRQVVGATEPAGVLGAVHEQFRRAKIRPHVWPTTQGFGSILHPKKACNERRRVVRIADLTCRHALPVLYGLNSIELET